MRPDSNAGGISRRGLLQVGLTSTLGLSLADILRLRAAADIHGKQAPTKVKSCILVWLAGGASHIDTFDPKPEAPSDIRGEFKPIDTSVPGLKIGELFPKLAGNMNRLTLVRSLTSPEADHDRAAHHVLTGYRPSPALVYPSYGSVVAKLTESRVDSLPTHVAAPDAPLFAGSGYLTPAYDPFLVGGDPNLPGFRVRDLTPPDRLTLDRLKRRRSMVGKLDSFGKDVAPTPLTSSRDRFSGKAYDLLTSSAAQNAFKIEEEPAAVRDVYGRNSLGQTFLLARRLIEAGVSFVTVNDRGQGNLAWDTHQRNFPTLRETLAPPLDQGLSALIDDLDKRGKLSETLIVMMGEFGRTPKINQNAGRDHHGRANCAILAGAGVPRGLVVGRTDAKADAPVEDPVTPADLAATIYRSIGIDPDYQFQTPDGRPIRLVDGGRPIKSVVGA